MIRAIRAMDEADVCMLVLDASKGVTAQDVSIYSLAARKGKLVLIQDKIKFSSSFIDAVETFDNEVFVSCQGEGIYKFKLSFS